MAPPKPLNFGTKPAENVPPQVLQPVVPAAASTAVVPAQSTAVAVPQQALTLDVINRVGGSSQRGISQLSSQLASSVKTSDMDALGDLLGKTLVAAKGYDPSTTKGKLFGLIKRKVEEIRIGYESADSTVTRLVNEIDKRVALHAQRTTDIKAMIKANQDYHAALGPEIEQLLARVEWMEANVPAVDPNDPMSAQRVQDWNTVCTMGRKHADDLARSRVVSQQMDAQMNMLVQQGIMLQQKFDSFKTTTLPILRQAFVMYILALEQEKSAKMANSVDDLTDNTLRENARKLNQTTSAVHTSLARSSISLDAIQESNRAMIESLNEVERIRSEMKARLAAEAPQIEAASRELAARLAQQQP